MFTFAAKVEKRIDQPEKRISPSESRPAPEAPKCDHPECKNGQWFEWKTRTWRTCARCMGKGYLTPIDNERKAIYDSPEFERQRRGVAIQRRSGFSVDTPYKEWTDYV